MKSHALIVWPGITAILILLVTSGCGSSDTAGGSEETLISEEGRIAFTSDGAGQDGKIQAINADGSGLTTLTDGRDYDAFPAWRP